MELKVENKEIDSASFLDLGLQVEDKNFKSNLYDKQEAFKFCQTIDKNIKIRLEINCK